MERGIILDPTVTRMDNVTDSGPDAGPLAGKCIGFRTDIMWRSWDWVVESWAAFCRAEGAETRIWCAPGHSDSGMNPELEKFLDGVDVAIVGLGNCGACTGWTIHDAVMTAGTGRPTAAVVTANFASIARSMARRGGRSGLRIQVLPYPLNELPKEEIEEIARQYWPEMAHTVGAQLATQGAAA